MATSLPNSKFVTDKIRVKGIPSTINSDKLTIYFQKRKVGGGDVASVTFPLSNQEPDAAIITFEEAETVQSVLQKNHSIGGKEVTVEPIKPQPLIFDKVTAQLSDFVIQRIKSKNESTEDVFETITDSTGCVIDESGQSCFVKGEWYQVKAAFERFEAVVSENQSHSLPQSMNGYLSRTPTQPVQTVIPPISAGHPTARARNQSVPLQSPSATQTRVVVSTIIDKDIYAYLELVHGADLANLKNRFKVEFKCHIIGDAAKVEVIPTSNDTDTPKAVKAFDEFGQKISASLSQDTVEIDSKFPQDLPERIFPLLRPEFPLVHMDRVHDSPNHILFTASDSDRCRMAKDMFKHFLQREQEVYAHANPGSSGDRDESNKIAVDKDVYAYLELTRKDELNRIWDANEVQIQIKIIGECAEIFVVPKPTARAPKVQAAIDEFQKVYNPANDGLCQQNFDMRTLSSIPGDSRVNEAISLVKSRHYDVHVARIASDNHHILFIASTEEKCADAMKLLCNVLRGTKR